ncbi:MAG: phosphatidate cytidylyltransferase [Gammaproteobacteria bacterium]|nr:phosphatidate cytidylyltransferase [Gammaproteobacteria bacterium]
MLKQRIITALWLIPLALLGFFALEDRAFLAFISVIVALAGWEWARLAGFEGQKQRIGYAWTVVAGLLLLNISTAWVLPALYLAGVWWLLAIAMVVTFPNSIAFWGGRLGKLVMGLIIIVPAGLGLQVLKALPQGNMLILSLMLLVWGADIGAYFFGRAFGKKKLAPRVSPGKSWAGLFGGLFCSLCIAAGLLWYFQVPLAQFVPVLLGAALVVLFSVVGDLTESMFKRQVGIKDSSQLLPGHGGVLDRIDSLTAAAPVFALLLLLSGWVLP